MHGQWIADGKNAGMRYSPIFFILVRREYELGLMRGSELTSLQSMPVHSCQRMAGVQLGCMCYTHIVS
jgi:hypothetical protein